mgnify:CR=1 FL=1
MVGKDDFICHYREKNFTGILDEDLIGPDQHAVVFKKLGDNYYCFDFAEDDIIQITTRNRWGQKFLERMTLLMIFVLEPNEVKEKGANQFTKRWLNKFEMIDEPKGGNQKGGTPSKRQSQKKNSRKVYK